MRLTHNSKKTAVKRLNALLCQTEELDVAVVLFQALDMICDAHQIEMPEEAVDVNIGLDNFFGCDVLNMC